MLAQMFDHAVQEQCFQTRTVARVRKHRAEIQSNVIRRFLLSLSTRVSLGLASDGMSMRIIQWCDRVDPSVRMCVRYTVARARNWLASVLSASRRMEHRFTRNFANGFGSVFGATNGAFFEVVKHCGNSELDSLRNFQSSDEE